MLRPIHLSLLALAISSNPAAAACNLFMADITALTECAKYQELVISLQAGEIEILHKEIETLKLVQGFHSRDIKKLSDRVFEIQEELHLLGIKITTQTK